MRHKEFFSKNKSRLALAIFILSALILLGSIATLTYAQRGRNPIPETEITLYVSPWGDDDQGDGSVFSPYRTIGKAISEAESLQDVFAEIMVAPGEYHENLQIDFPVALYGSGPDKTFIVGNEQAPVISIENGFFNIVEGFTITGGSSPHGGGFRVSNSLYCLITNNHIMDNFAQQGAGIFVAGSNFTIISNNIIAHNHCPELDEEPYQSSGGAIFWVEQSGGMGSIISNTIVDNFALIGSGVYYDGSPQIFFSSNIIVENLGGVALVAQGFLMNFRYNNVADNPAGNWSSNLDPYFQHPVYHNISEPQPFITGPLGEYYLPAGSPGVDAGEPDIPCGFGAPIFGTTDVNHAPDYMPIDQGYHYSKIFVFASPSLQVAVVGGSPANEDTGIIEDGELYIIWEKITPPHDVFTEGPLPITEEVMDRLVSDNAEYYFYPRSEQQLEYDQLRIKHIWALVSPRAGIIEPNKNNSKADSIVLADDEGDDLERMSFYSLREMSPGLVDTDGGGEEDYYELMRGADPLDASDDDPNKSLRIKEMPMHTILDMKPEIRIKDINSNKGLIK